MTTQFEADVCAATGKPRLRLNFANGWSASIVLRMEQRGGHFAMAALAAYPTDPRGIGATELGESEASPEEVAAYIAEIAARPQVAAS